MVRHRSVTTRCTMRFSRSFPPGWSSPAARFSSCCTWACWSGSRAFVPPSRPWPVCRVCRMRSGRRRSAEIAARHGQGHAGDVGGLVGGEEQDRRRLLLRSCRSASSGWTRPSGPRSAGTRPSPARVGGAALRGMRRGGASVPPGAIAADADAVFGILEGEAGGDGVHAALGRRIGHAVDAARRDRGDVDDDAAARAPASPAAPRGSTRASGRASGGSPPRSAPPRNAA